MNKAKAKEILEAQKEKIRENHEKYQEAEKNLDETQAGADLLGPRDELEYQRLLKDIEASDNDE